VSALVFLMTRRFVHSFTRAFNNPGRSAGTVVVVGLLLLAYGGPLISGGQRPTAFASLLQLMPPLEIISSVLTLMVFGFLALSFEVAMNYTRAFTDSDVGILFPTPLPRKLVFFFSLFSRGLLGTFAGACLIAYFFFSTSRSLFAHVSAGWSLWPALTGAAGFALLFLVANAAILEIGVLSGLGVFNGKISKPRLRATVLAVFALFIIFPLWHFSEYTKPGAALFATFLRQLNQPPSSLLFLPFRAIADCALISFGGLTPAIPEAVFFWTAVFLVCTKAIISYTPTLYEYAINLAQGNALRREMMKKTSLSLPDSVIRKASAGKPVPLWRWMARWNPTGAAALFWRNLLLVRRFGGFLIVKVYVAVTLILGAGIVILRTMRPGMPVSELLGLGGIIQFFLLFAFVPSSVAWLSQTLNRFELQKPLPLSATSMVAAELLTPSLAVLAASFFGLVVLGLIFPGKLALLILGYLTVGSGFIIMTALMFIVLLFNPDQNDTLQRMLFGFALMIVFLLAFVPSGIVIAISFFVHTPLPWTTLLVVTVNGSCAYALLALASRKYQSFNPTD